MPHAELERVPGPIDTLIVPGGRGVRDAVRDRALLRGVARAGAARATRGLGVHGRVRAGRARPARWPQGDHALGELRAPAPSYPAVRVESEPIFVRDGHVYTSAGVTAGIDLALALVEEDLGRDAALAIARGLVLFLRRPGNQAQFSAQLAQQTADREPLREVQRFIAEHPGHDSRPTCWRGART